MDAKEEDEMGKIINIANEAELAAALKEANGAVVLDFYATGCEACEADEGDLKKLAKSCAGVTVVKIDVDKASAMADRWQVQGTPSIFVAQSAVDAVPGVAKEVDWAGDAVKLLKCKR